MAFAENKQKRLAHVNPSMTHLGVLEYFSYISAVSANFGISDYLMSFNINIYVFQI